MSDENNNLPIEIPWKLACSSQPLELGEPAQTSISLFTFEPDDELLNSQFPNERLIYLKFTLSVSPGSIPNSPPIAAIGEGIPCFYLQLDLRIRKASGDIGTIRPYFHSAAPLHRTMIQTGVVGLDVFEGESDGQSIGKSGSQMYESSRNLSQTNSTATGGSVSVGPLSFGSSGRNTSTEVLGQRNIAQFTDTTERQASEERRQLLSHWLKVENVLTLLNGKYIGTPYLRFSLSPRPLSLLSVDPTDPNIWFNQLLQRRSSGIEGIQEFTTIIVVPKGQDFCVNAKLRRVCVLDDPPGPLTFTEQFSNLPGQIIRLINYLNRTYPRGTPLGELDVDVTENLLTSGTLVNPVVDRWLNSIQNIVALEVKSPAPLPAIGASNGGVGNYKHAYEVWLETLKFEYEQDAARSPLERGVLLGENRFLDTCFSFDENDNLLVTRCESSVEPLFVIPNDDHNTNTGGVSTMAGSQRRSARELALEQITHWSLLETRIATILSNQVDKSFSKFRFDDKNLVRLLIDKWCKLSPEDSHNLPLAEVIKIIKLSEVHRRILTSIGVKDLKTMAHSLKIAADVERYNTELEQIDEINEFHKSTKELFKPIQYPITSKDSMEMCNIIGKSLQANVSDISTIK